MLVVIGVLATACGGGDEPSGSGPSTIQPAATQTSQPAIAAETPIAAVPSISAQAPSPIPAAPTAVPVPDTPVPIPLKGNLSIRVTDQPNPDIQKILVTTNKIEINATQGDGETGWVTVLGGNDLSFDLLAVAGIEKVLGDSELPVGLYPQIRMHVVSVIVTIDGEEIEATVPSGVIRVVGPIRIDAGETTISTFDFDAKRSVVVTGAGRVQFKPVVKLRVRKGTEPFQPAGAQAVPITAPTAIPEPSDTASPEPVATADAVATPTPTDSAIPVPEERPTATVEPTPVPSPTPTATAIRTPTVVPTPTSTPDPLGDMFLIIESPPELESISELDNITVTGRTRIDAAVTVNDDFVELDVDGTFEIIVPLIEGINIIEVVASVSTGEQLDEVLVVIFSP